MYNREYGYIEDVYLHDNQAIAKVNWIYNENLEKIKPSEKRTLNDVFPAVKHLKIKKEKHEKMIQKIDDIIEKYE